MMDNNIKTISLKQPWATLLVLGVKTIETRSWASAYRGPLAIHASASTDKDLMAFLGRDKAFQSALKSALGERYDSFSLSALPRGCVLGVGFLETCLRIPRSKTTYQSSAAKSANFRRGVTLPPETPELEFGDYEPGRYAWVFGRVKAFAKPIPARGALALWEWNYGDYEEAIRAVEELHGQPD